MAVVPIPARRRLTDAELLVTEFRFEDPEGIPGLNLAVPDPDAHPTIIGYYDVTPPGGELANPGFPRVRCCHCGKRLHWQGRVVRDDHGEIYIIGARGCGREHYGERYVDAEKHFRSELARKGTVRRWREMLDLIAGYEQDCEALLRSPVLAAIELKASDIKRASPEGYRKIVRHAETNQDFVARWEDRDFEQEAERDRRYEQAAATYRYLPPQIRKEWEEAGRKPERETEPIFRQRTMNFGKVQGAGFMTAAGDVRRAALDLRDTIRAVKAIEREGTDRAMVKALHQRLRELTERPRILRSAIDAARSAPSFFTASNLDRLESWSRHEQRFTYQRTEGGLFISDLMNGRTVIPALGPVALPHCPSLAGASGAAERVQLESMKAA